MSAVEKDEFHKPVHGTRSQNLIEKIVRFKIYESQYWKEHCFGLTAELLVDKTVQLKYYGGVCSETNKPTPFLCLLMKMLQMQPEFEIIQAFIRCEEFKYMRLLGATYLRLVGTPHQIYSELEPLLLDYRKISFQLKNGWRLTFVDEVIDELLNEDIVLNIVLPRLSSRILLVETGKLKERTSPLQEELDSSDEEQELRKEQKEQPTIDLQLDEMSLSSFSDDDEDEDQETETKEAEASETPPTAKNLTEKQPKKKKKKKKKKKRKQFIKGLKLRNLVASTTGDSKDTDDAGTQAPGAGPNASSNPTEEEFDIQYWNEQRKKLGLKPLKP